MLINFRICRFLFLLYISSPSVYGWLSCVQVVQLYIVIPTERVNPLVTGVRRPEDITPTTSGWKLSFTNLNVRGKAKGAAE